MLFEWFIPQLITKIRLSNLAEKPVEENNDWIQNQELPIQLLASHFFWQFKNKPLLPRPQI